MASSLSKFTVVESGNVGLGQGGAIFEDGTTVISSKTIVAIQFVDDSAFTTLTPSTSDFIGTAGGNGDAIDSDNVFPAGMTIYGRYIDILLTDGSCIAYLG